MNKILVPFDFSDVATKALDFAVQLGNIGNGCDVVLFHIIEHPSASTLKTMGINDFDPMEVIYMKKLIAQTEDRLTAIVTEKGAGKVTLKYKIRLGNPGVEVLEMVESDKIDLVVMGTRGAEGMNEFFIGSNAEKVVRHAACPVITMKNAANANNVKEMVFASDFEKIDEDFIGHIKAVQKMLGARLRIVKINTPAGFFPSRLDNTLMDKFIKNHGLENCTKEIYNFSNAEDGIMAYAEDIGAHMICLGTHQLKGAKHFLKGSIAEDVVNHANVPVWTYHLKTS